MPEREEADRSVYIVPHTHWDREWYAPFQVFRAQLVDLWDELLTITETDPDFRFLMDGQTVVIDDYLEIRPQARARVDHAIRERRIEVGPWYTLPDEFLVSGESLVRNLQRGLAKAASHGGSLQAGYLPDSFGHAAQMPQIYQQFGFKHAVVWRGVPLEIDRLAFNWESPDGSEILTAYMGSSYSHGVDLPTEPSALAARVRAALKAIAGFHPTGPVLLMNGNDHVLPQRDLAAAVRAANQNLAGVRVKLSGLGEYLRTLTDGDWPRWQGELRSSARANVLMGTLSVRVPDKQAYFEAGLMLERIAEPLAALSGLDVGGFLDQAWRLVLQNAAHDTACGSGIDAVADESRLRSHSVHQIAQAITSRCLPLVAGDGQVWNPSPFPRQGLVEIEIDDTAIPEGAQALGPESKRESSTFRFPAKEVGRVHAVLDELRIAGERIGAFAIQKDGATLRVAVETAGVGPEMDLAPARLEIEALADQPGTETIAVEVAPRPRRRILVLTPTVAGYSVATLRPYGSSVGESTVRATNTTLDNGLLRCRLDADGTIAVEHSASGLSYIGLNRLVDEADAGDEYNFSPPLSGGSRGRPVGVEGPVLRQAGPLRGSLATRLRYVVPAGLRPDRGGPSENEVSMELKLEVSLERDVPRLDIQIDVENPARDHRLRVHFPFPFSASNSHADTAYHVTRRAVVAPRQDEGSPELELPTFPMRTFVDVSGSRGGIALIGRGLHEYEVIPGAKSELALTLLRAVGWLSRDDLSYRSGHAGPAMQTPGAQVIGSHSFRYSLFFHKGGWEEAAVWRAAESVLLPLVVSSSGCAIKTPTSIELEPDCIQLTACVPRADGFELRLLNASDRDQDAVVRLLPAPAEVQLINLGGKAQKPLALEGQLVRLPLRRWEIATVQVRGSVQKPARVD